MTLPYGVSLYNSVKRGGGFITDITDRALNWKRSIRRIGGFWQGSFEYQGNRDELDDLFFDGLMKEVREFSGGVMAWQGFIGDMVYRRGSITWRRSIHEVTNAVKVLFTRQYANALTNGSAESGAWTPFDGGLGGPPVVTQSTDWASDGTYSCKIVTTSADIMGAVIQSGIPIVSDTAYNFTMTLNILSGDWVVVIHPDGDPAMQIVLVVFDNVTGVVTANLTIPEVDSFDGNVTIKVQNGKDLAHGASNGTVYGDAAVFTRVPNSSDTGWVTDAGSISEYGRLEEVLVEGALSAEGASAKVLTTLKRKAWPRLLAPDTFGGEDIADEYSLSVVCYGYIFTLPWTINTYVAASTMSNYVTQLAAGRDYISSAQVDTNATAYTADNRYPITIWQVLKNIVTAGDSSGNLWSLGVGINRVLTYQQFSTTIAYRYRGGKLYNPAGGEMEAWLAFPGWALLDDAPIVPYQTSDAMDDPRRIIVEEVEFTAPDILRFKSRVSE